jgi:hypothetical protein
MPLPPKPYCASTTPTGRSPDQRDDALRPCQRSRIPPVRSSPGSRRRMLGGISRGRLRALGIRQNSHLVSPRNGAVARVRASAERSAACRADGLPQPERRMLVRDAGLWPSGASHGRLSRRLSSCSPARSRLSRWRRGPSVAPRPAAAVSRRGQRLRQASRPGPGRAVAWMCLPSLASSRWCCASTSIRTIGSAS